MEPKDSTIERSSSSRRSKNVLFLWENELSLLERLSSSQREVPLYIIIYCSKFFNAK